jgi:hypothetical protein
VQLDAKKKKTTQTLETKMSSTSKTVTPAIGSTTAETSATTNTHIVRRFTTSVVAADLATAAVVGCTAGIPISIIDYSIMAKVAGIVPSMGHQVKAGVRTLVFSPQRFFFDTPDSHYAKVFRACFTVYGGTYASNNIARSYYEAQGDSSTAVAWKCGLISSAVNTCLTIWKDSFILRVMPKSMASGKGSGSGNYVPWVSRAGFAFRDTVTCVAAFTVVPLLAEYLKARRPEMSESSCKTTAQLATPCVAQFLTTAVHIPSIKYQRLYPNAKFSDMVDSLRTDYRSALGLRIFRIFCSFGTAGILNYSLRPELIDRFEPHAWMHSEADVKSGKH